MKNLVSAIRNIISNQQIFRLNVVVFVASFSFMTGLAQSYGSLHMVRWDDEARDTIRINQILHDAHTLNCTTPGQTVAAIGKMFVGTPYVAHTLEGETEALTVSLDRLDCTTFVEMVMALAKTANENRLSWRDFLYNLEHIRYRGGELNGYASRLHYICDWVLDNCYRDNIKDVTTNFPQVSYAVKSIDFMTSNKSRYAALADTTAYDRIRSVEEGFRNYRFPYIKASHLANKKAKAVFREGDILAFTTSIKNLDVTHMGIIVGGSDGEWHVMHASSTNGQVEITTIALQTFLKRNPSMTGVRVLRLL